MENPYLQYFCGFERLQHEATFAPTLFVTLRRRLIPERFAAFEQVVMDRMAGVEQRSVSAAESQETDNDDVPAPPTIGTGSERGDDDTPVRRREAH